MQKISLKVKKFCKKVAILGKELWAFGKDFIKSAQNKYFSKTNN